MKLRTVDRLLWPWFARDIKQQTSWRTNGMRFVLLCVLPMLIAANVPMTIGGVGFLVTSGLMCVVATFEIVDASLYRLIDAIRKSKRK